MTNENTAPFSENSSDVQSSPAEIKEERAAERLIEDGKATSPEREAMYDEDTLGTPGKVGESGSQGGTTGREDQNPIGQRSA